MNKKLHKRYADSAAALLAAERAHQLNLTIGGEEAITGLIAAIIGSDRIDHDAILADAFRVCAKDLAAVISAALFRHEGRADCGGLWELHPDGCFTLN